MIPISKIEKLIKELEYKENMAIENKKAKYQYAERHYYHGVERGYRTSIDLLNKLLHTVVDEKLITEEFSK